MKSCLSQRETRITYCVSCPLCFSIRKIKTSVRWFISPRSRCRTWNRFILPLIPRSCTISYIFFKVINLTYPETYANISTQCICTKKNVKPCCVTYGPYYMVGCKPSQNEKHIFGIGRKTSPDAHWNLDFSWKFLGNLNRTF